MAISQEYWNELGKNSILLNAVRNWRDDPELWFSKSVNRLSETVRVNYLRKEWKWVEEWLLNIGAKKIEWFNSEAQKLFKFNKVYDEGTPITHIIRNPIFVEYINLAEISKEPVYFKHDKKDEVISIQVFEVPFGKDMSLLTFRDISAFEKLDSVRSDFIANVSHELKTPLTVISGYLEMLKSDSVGKEESQKFYNEMLDQSLRMNRIIGDLILITNLQTTKPIESKKEKIIS